MTVFKGKTEGLVLLDAVTHLQHHQDVFSHMLFTSLTSNCSFSECHLINAISSSNDVLIVTCTHNSGILDKYN